MAKRALAIALIKKTGLVKPKILDIGCGTGKNVEAFSRLGKVFGIDQSPEAVSYCKQRSLKNTSLGSAARTGFPPNTFQIVTLLDVLEHTDERTTLNELKKILVPGGFVIINVPAYAWLWSKWDEVLHHKRRYTHSSLIHALTRNGFQILHISYAFSFLVLPVYLIRAIKSRLKQEYTSDFKIGSPMINSLLTKVAQIERFFVLTTGIPAGTSVICLAQKRV
jgi:SAM-dependent methyltransferase